MRDSKTTLKQIIWFTQADLRKFERRLKELNDIAREVEEERQRLRAIIAQMKNPEPMAGEPDDMQRPGPRRMSRRMAKQRRAEAGEGIHSYMASKPKGTEFSFGQLQRQFDRDIAFMFTRILDEWNAAHPSKQIGHNGKARAARRYHLI